MWRAACFVLLFLTTAVLGQFGKTEQIFPHFAIGGGATTRFSIHNPGDEMNGIRRRKFVAGTLGLGAALTGAKLLEKNRSGRSLSDSTTGKENKWFTGRMEEMKGGPAGGDTG